MTFPTISINKLPIIPIESFREMDYLALGNYNLSIELMMENAGLHLARLATSYLPEKGELLIGIGIGNNGGGGLVAARRLAGWGYSVFLDIPDLKLNELPSRQLKRALLAGVKIKKLTKPQLFIDAYFGFSQRLPLPSNFKKAIRKANKLSCPKLSLDIPSGFNRQTFDSLFNPTAILTLAAMKTELLSLLNDTQIYIADLGISSAVYKKFKIPFPGAFKFSGIIEVSA